MVKKFYKTPNLDLSLIINFKKKFKKNINQSSSLNHLTPIKLHSSSIPYPPNISELYFLYEFTKINKRLTVLEFGSGWSSLFFYFALIENKKKYQKFCEKNIRNSNLFELFILENEKKFLKKTKERIKKNSYLIRNKIKVNYNFSDINMIEFNNLICHSYNKLPLCNPDLIYLDGPDQHKVKGDVNGINIKHPDLMPMSCDLLKIEFFLRPGTIIIIDGRAANYQFLTSQFKRNWTSEYIARIDKYILYLDAPSLGKASSNLLNFYKK